MKKIFLLAVMAVATMTTAQAQSRVVLSTYNGTDMARYDGQDCKLTVNRYVFTGWNTIALPFAVSEEELNATFGNDCRLEKLVGVESQGSHMMLCFQDCKQQGIQPGVPYILHYTGAPSTKTLTKQAVVDNQPAVASFTTANGETVRMIGAQTKTDDARLYGVLAADNSEARFVQIGQGTSGFYATRCYIEVVPNRSMTLSTIHLAKGEATSINTVAAAGELIDVYNLAGRKVASKVSADEVNNLPSAIYVVKGQKVIVK